ncbi:transcription factor TFIIIC subunit TFC1 [Aspergillus ruber CBS 135680]|uniref:RNA polymerase III transcription factor IIIC subunit-domain-containing protein n=1 Tax=Aspergillus ruber (strain CBS 135680) TaxID=1388766 RepID=A0A017S714_ASPRC|nr:uncharacterized protein EURHEDRAFT_388264 [Aspergillus ruber CBS 135680]EYE92833.1 hypothetical protein EURHEDRAFT_388264 [Aspergillus ruber CBS 135680]
MSGEQRTAPFYTIPPHHIASVEHPAIIRNVDKAIDTLEGNVGISKILNSRADTRANLVLRPEDAMSRPLQSTNSQTNNVLLRVTVPRRTGRRRKRGTEEPFTETTVSSEDGARPRRSARDLRRSLEDNVGRYQVEPVGMVNRTHVFRGMPDFVWSTSSSEFTNRFRDHILSFDYEKMKQFDINMSKGAISNVDIIPPPSYSHGDIPFNYFYRQNPTVKQSLDKTGQPTTINTSSATKIATHLVPYDIPTVPQAAHPGCPPISTLEPVLQETISVLESLFSTRPAWTRRGLRNSLTKLEQRHALKHAVPYVGYIFRSGPWRDAIVKHGHDPRSSPDYRIYQTAMFRLLPREPEVARDGGGSANSNTINTDTTGMTATGGHGGVKSNRRHTHTRYSDVAAINPFTNPSSRTTLSSDNTFTTTTPVPAETTHIFTGTPPLPHDGRMWMFCDIADPLLRNFLFPPNPSDPTTPPPGFLRETCEPVTDGWYGTGTMAKAKAIMRAKILALTENRTTDDEAEFGRILAFPDHVDEQNLNEEILQFSCEGEGVGSREMQMATDIRAAIRGAASWRAVVRRPGGVDGKDGNEVGEGGKKVQWEDEGEGDEGSEGEEVEMQDQEGEDEDERDDAEDQDEDDEMDEGS